jgi:hypothetical protein
MAASTANQKVFVPLQGVLKLQDAVRRVEQEVERLKQNPDTYSATINAAIRQHDGLRDAVVLLELPVEVRRFNK